MSLQEIETAIAQLPPEQVSELYGWLSDYHARLWDGQIADDLEAGRLDSVLEEAEREYDRLIS